MFNREFHQKILTVLNNLNAYFLADCHAYFGGGTLVSLRHGDHRLSKDIDFMCPIGQGYRQLRQGIFDRGTDSLAEKLLANADRWLDHRKDSRDLIDLSIQRLASPIPAIAIAKAENAYPVIEPLKRAIRNFQQQPNYREECFKNLMVNAPEKIIDGLDLLASDFGIEATTRRFSESR